MRKIFFYPVISLFFFATIKTGKGFVVRGYITGIADSTQVMLRNISSGEELDSAYVIKGRFTFHGKLEDAPDELRIISGRKELQKGNLFYTDLLIGNETVRVNGDISDMPLNVSTTGSPIQEKAETYHKQLYAWNEKLNNLRAKLKMFPDSVSSIGKQQLISTVQAMKDSLENWKVEFIRDNFNTYNALVLYNYRRDFNADTLKRLYSSLSAEL